jgi:hypothetical protein
VATALAHLSAGDQRRVLEELLKSADGFVHVERIYRNASDSRVRGQIISAISPVQGAAALSLLSSAARSDRNQAVRRAALQALSRRADHRE